MKKIYIDYNGEKDQDIWRDYEKTVYLIIKALRIYYKSRKTIFILLTNSNSMTTLNRKYRNVEKDTNVISLEMDDELCLGEIILSFNKIQQEFQAMTLPNQAYKRIYPMMYKSFTMYLFFVISHGFLHLLGYDHQTNEEEEKMNEEQARLFLHCSKNIV